MKFLTTLIAASFLAACGARSSDEERVRELVADLETAAEARDASDVLDLVAADYEDAQGFDRAQLQNFLRGYFLAHPKVELLVNIESLEFPADGLAQAEISVTTLELNDPDHARLKVEFRRDGDEWKIRRADRKRP
jgi:ketosteroid isomerase-like protein